MYDHGALASFDNNNVFNFDNMKATSQFGIELSNMLNITVLGHLGSTSKIAAYKS